MDTFISYCDIGLLSAVCLMFLGYLGFVIFERIDRPTYCCMCSQEYDELEKQKKLIEFQESIKGMDLRSHIGGKLRWGN